jgi:hypothetical protein
MIPTALRGSLAAFFLSLACSSDGGSGGGPGAGTDGGQAASFPTLCVEARSDSGDVVGCECGLYACVPQGTPGIRDDVCICYTGRTVSSETVGGHTDRCNLSLVPSGSECCFGPQWFTLDNSWCGCGADFCEGTLSFPVASCDAAHIEAELFQPENEIVEGGSIRLVAVPSCEG